MTGRRLLVVEIDTLTLPRSAIVTGPDRIIRPALDTLGIRYQRDPRRRAWLIPKRQSDDLAALVEHAGHSTAQPFPTERTATR